MRRRKELPKESLREGFFMANLNLNFCTRNFFEKRVFF
ncbi:hypothetical protein SMIDD28_00152 [Streptococcus mitis]|uniref:Uncharacterized protein n=1 Tax=Streptococcus mitis TaxID=28037 RepID=A0A139QCF0_STRMT|nr:hypothetical protein SMIDD28_00152 [Streptococcus mitis]